MEKEFVPYELAVKLKELGFDEPCFGRFYTKPKCKMFSVDEKGRHYQIKNTPKKLYTVGEYFVLNDDNAITAPTFSQAFRWFREKYDIVSYIQRFEGNTFDYECNSPKFKEVIDFEDGPFDTYEEAERACLERLIDKITNKKIFDFVTDL